MNKYIYISTLKKSLVFIIFVIALSSCSDMQDENSFLEKNRNLHYLENIDRFNSSERDLIKDIFAQSLSKVIINDEIRSFIKEEAVKQFDGDYDILFNKVKHQKFGDLTFAQHIIINLPNFSDKAFHEGKNERLDIKAIEVFLKNLDLELKYFPLLNISIPHYGDDWDSEIIPPVAGRSEDVYLNFNKGLKFNAYTFEGNIVELTSNILPETPVIIIGENERVIYYQKDYVSNNGRLSYLYLQTETLQPVHEDAQYTYYLRDDLNNCILDTSGGSGGTGTGSTNNTCDRDKPSSITHPRERLRNIAFLSMDKLKEAEGWTAGKIDLAAYVLWLKQAQKFDEPFHISIRESRDKYRGCAWFNCWIRTYDPNYDLFHWREDIDGDNILVRFYEEAYHHPVKVEVTMGLSVKLGESVSISGTSVKVTFEIGDKDRKLGDTNVYYCDDARRTYKNNFLKFQIIREDL